MVYTNCLNQNYTKDLGEIWRTDLDLKGCWSEHIFYIDILMLCDKLEVMIHIKV